MGQSNPVSAIEEIIVGSKSLPFEDYLDCRIMNLLVETFYNNALMEEVFAMCRAIEVSVFDCLLYLKNHPELYSSRVRAIIDEFVVQTSSDPFDTFDEAKTYVLTPDVIDKYIGGKLGINELLVHKALLFAEFEDISTLVYTAVTETLRNQGLLTPRIEHYLSELRQYTVLRKRACITDTDVVYHGSFRYDFDAIRRQGYRVDPNTLPVAEHPIDLSFFHDTKQKQHLAHQLSLYAGTPIGIGRLIQRSNLKLIYRSVSSASPLPETATRLEVRI